MLTPTDYPAESQLPGVTHRPQTPEVPGVPEINEAGPGGRPRDNRAAAPVIPGDASSESHRLDHLRALEAESIHIIREVVAEFERPVMLYSIGKDSSVLLRLAQKAFYPGPIPFPLLHVDTTYKFREMIEFRDRYARRSARGSSSTPTRRRSPTARSPSRSARSAAAGCSRPSRCSTRCEAGGFDAAFGGARRDEERSRAKERVVLAARRKGQWDPKRQRPELWHLLNSRIRPGESIRVFPLSNWTELDVWHYIEVGADPGRPALFRAGARRHRARQLADRARAAVRAAPARASGPSA